MSLKAQLLLLIQLDKFLRRSIISDISKEIKARYFHVEDSPSFAGSTERILQLYNYERVELATTVKEAHVQAEAGLYAVANFGLIDFNLPDGTGRDVVELLRNLGVTAYLIAFSGSDECYGDETIRKGDPEILLERLNVLFCPPTS